MIIFKRILSVFLRIGISIIFISLLLHQVDKGALLAVIKNTDKLLLFAAFFIFFLNYLLCFFRWVMLLKAAGIRLPLKRVIISFSGGVFFNFFLPSTIGGDLMRSIDLAAHTGKPKEVVATVLLDRLSGYTGLVILAILALFFGARFIKDKSVLLSILIITGLLVLILLVFFNNFVYLKINRFLGNSSIARVRESLKSLHQQIHIFRNDKILIIKNLFLSFLVQLTAPLTFYFIALSLGIKIEMIYFFIFLPIIGAITLLPISIGGLGLRDATTIFFFAKAGLAKDLSFAMSLISFLFILIFGALGGLIYVLTVHHRRIQSSKISAFSLRA